MKDSTLNRTHSNTKGDSTLSLVMRYVLEGWPGTTNECAEPAHAYFTYREELTIIDGLLVKGNHIVIPNNMCHDWLETMHASHLGVNKTLMQASTSVFWPGMTADITALISNWPCMPKVPVQTTT